METIILTAFIAALILLGLYVLCKFWHLALIALSTILLAVSCSHNSKASTMEVAAIIESEADRTGMQYAVRDAGIILDQLGLDLSRHLHRRK